MTRGCRRLQACADAACPPRRCVGSYAASEFSKANSTVDDGVLDAAIRDVLNEWAPRRLAVLKPLKVTIENYHAGRIEEFDATNHPAAPAFGTRVVRFSREVYIEQDDFHEAPPHGFRRLAPGREVRLRYAYFVTCRYVVKDAAGRVVE